MHAGRINRLCDGIWTGSRPVHVAAKRLARERWGGHYIQQSSARTDDACNRRVPPRQPEQPQPHARVPITSLRIDCTALPRCWIISWLTSPLIGASGPHIVAIVPYETLYRPVSLTRSANQIGVGAANRLVRRPLEHLCRDQIDGEPANAACTHCTGASRIRSPRARIGQDVSSFAPLGWRP